MAFERIRKGPGVSRAKCICDDCEREEVVSANYSKRNHELDEGQLIRRMEGQGWTYIKKTLRCPSCEAKRKVVNIQEAKLPKVEQPKKPDRKQKRQIVDLLEEVYDTDGEFYIGGETDETVAATLGVLPGWVAEMREELFGPAGGNEDIEKLTADIDQFLSQSAGQINAVSEAVQHLEAQRKKATEFRTRLEAISKAVGARVLKKAGAG